MHALGRVTKHVLGVKTPMSGQTGVRGWGVGMNLFS